MVLPVILALIFASTVLPLFDAVLRRGQSRGSWPRVAVGGATVAIVGVLAVTLVSLVDQAEEVGDTATAGAEEVNEAAGGLLGDGHRRHRVGHRVRRAGHPGRVERDSPGWRSR